jgi:hypothetical protein
MKDTKKIMRELNEEEKYPPYFRSYEFKMFAVIASLLCVIIILILCAVPTLMELVDSKGDIVALMLSMIGLFALGYWALWGRKK